MNFADIKPLSDEVRSRLRSGVAITSLAQCVEELVLNSCDAGATCVAARVDAPNYQLQVIDNGSGINKEQMQFIGDRYATSKCRSVADLEDLQHYGFRGEALASIRDVTGVFEIISRPKFSSKTFCKLFKNGKPLEVFEAKQLRPSVGTTITVHDFFHNFPVRRKSMQPSLEFERALQRVESIALSHNSISFTLRNDYTGVKVLQTHKTNNVLSTFGQIFGVNKAKCMKEATYFHNQFKIEGHIGTEGHTNKSIQFIYINGRLVLKTKLHKLANLLLSKSIIVKSKACISHTTSQSKEQDGELIGSPRNTELHAMYVFDIKCARSEYDICLEPAKTLVEFRDWESILQCMENMILTFLQRENLTMKADMPKDLTEIEALLSDEECTLNLTKEQRVSDEEEEDLSQVKGTPKYNFSMFARDRPATEKYGDRISTANYGNTLQSLPAKRYHQISKTDDSGKEDVDAFGLGQSGEHVSVIPDNYREHNAPGSEESETRKDKHLDSQLDESTDLTGDSNAVEVEFNEDDSEDKEMDRRTLASSGRCVKLSKASGTGACTDQEAEMEKECGDELGMISERSASREHLSVAEKCARNSALTKKAYALVQKTSTGNEVTQPVTISGMPSTHRKIGSSSMKVLYDKLKEVQQCTTTERLRNVGQIRLKSYTSTLQKFRRSVTHSDVNERASTKEEIKSCNFGSSNSTSSNKVCVHNLAEPAESLSDKRPIVLSTSYDLGMRSKFPNARSMPLGIESHVEKTLPKHDETEKRQCKEGERSSGTGSNHDRGISHNVSQSSTADSIHQMATCLRIRKLGSINASELKVDSVYESRESDTKHEVNRGSELGTSKDRPLPDIQSLSTVKKSQVSKPNLGKLSQRMLSNASFQVKSFTSTKHIPPSSANRNVSEESTGKTFATADSFVDAINDACLAVQDSERTHENAEEICYQEANKRTIEISAGEPVVSRMSVKEYEEDNKSCKKEQSTAPKRKGAESPQHSVHKKFCSTSENSFKSYRQYRCEAVLEKTTAGECVDNEKENTSIENVPESKAVSSHDDGGALLVKTAITKCSHEESTSDVSMENEVLDVVKPNHSDAIALAKDTTATENMNIDSVHENYTLETHSIVQPEEANKMKDQTEIDEDVKSQNLSSKWISRFDVSIGKRLYIDVTTGETRLVPPPRAELQPPEAKQNQHITGVSSSIFTSMNTSDGNHGVHPHLSHNATPLLPKDRKKRLMTSAENDVPHESSAATEETGIGQMWDEYMEGQNEDVTSKWRNETRCQAEESSKVEEMFNAWENPVFSVPEKYITDTNTTSLPSNRSDVKIRGTINQYKFTKDMFDTIQVVGQVDDKFVACLVNTQDESHQQSTSPNLLVLIDQHAAHERIRLEQLTKDTYEKGDDNEADGTKPQIKSSIVTPPVNISLSAAEVRLLQAFRSDIERLGVKFNVTGDTDIEISTLPACLMEKEANHIKRGRQPVAISIIETLLKEHIDLLQQTSGASAVLPRTLTKVLNSQACHGAIKFGDHLERLECVSLISYLSGCNLPFQCAHGRPSLLPIIDLKLLEKQLQTKGSGKLRLWKLKQLMEDKDQEVEL
ncbi:LOW QUALITY PROTEIN: DNA mismatch repair protein Mlh3-like [Ptychodera flava]|uniref:LOW QUALITY PROTEIN: DNA mismatch repair protein Mlh3-like n=1 Tax=Ptychodera flava TaxID=63121 RepID=UPI003969E794